MAKKKVRTKRGLKQDKLLVAAKDKNEVDALVKAEKKKGVKTTAKKVREAVKKVGHSRKLVKKVLEG